MGYEHGTTCRTCGGEVGIDVVCAYCLKAQAFNDYLARERQGTRLLPWQLLVLSRWLRSQG